MDSFNETWNLVCDYCKTRITKVAFQTWISRIEPKEIDFDMVQIKLLSFSMIIILSVWVVVSSLP